MNNDEPKVLPRVCWSMVVLSVCYMIGVAYNALANYDDPFIGNIVGFLFLGAVPGFILLSPCLFYEPTFYYRPVLCFYGFLVVSFWICSVTFIYSSNHVYARWQRKAEVVKMTPLPPAVNTWQAVMNNNIVLIVKNPMSIYVGKTMYNTCSIKTKGSKVECNKNWTTKPDKRSVPTVHSEPTNWENLRNGDYEK